MAIVQGLEGNNFEESSRPKSFSFNYFSGDAIFNWLPCLQLVYVPHS